MKTMLALALTALLWASPVLAETQLTIYNQNFATVKETRTLDLAKGESELRLTDITAHLEPDSVVLRDLKKPEALRILEQNYESDPLSEGLLLLKSEGKVLDFEITVPQTGEKKLVKGKIVRSGYVPHIAASQRYGQEYSTGQMAHSQPIVEVDGKIQFGLPGKPIFDALHPESFLKPTLLWRLWTSSAGKHEVEFSYLTGGMSWEATYNAIAPEKGDKFDLAGWVTLENKSGKDFEQAGVKLMAGDVARARPRGLAAARKAEDRTEGLNKPMSPEVTERTFEEYHLYTLPRATTLIDWEIKQVEFLQAVNIPARRIYVYDGVKIGERQLGWSDSAIRNSQEYGTQSNPNVWVMLEFENSEKSHLGMPLPKGKVKMYRRDEGGRNEFIGEDEIRHIPKDETVRLSLGNAFDLVGERRQTNYLLDTRRQLVEESFEIKVRNHKKDAVEVRVVEHLYRWLKWQMQANSLDFRKTDARTVEFRPTVPANGQATITCTVRYTWGTEDQ